MAPTRSSRLILLAFRISAIFSGVNFRNTASSIAANRSSSPASSQTPLQSRHTSTRTFPASSPSMSPPQFGHTSGLSESRPSFFVKSLLRLALPVRLLISFLSRNRPWHAGHASSSTVRWCTCLVSLRNGVQSLGHSRASRIFFDTPRVTVRGTEEAFAPPHDDSQGTYWVQRRQPCGQEWIHRYAARFETRRLFCGPCSAPLPSLHILQGQLGLLPASSVERRS